MRFLVDRCAGRRLARWLREQGHEVAESLERGPDPGDRVVLEWAAAEGRVLITLDKDFGDFLFLERIRHAGIIRLPDVPAAKRIGMVKTILEQHGHQLGPQTVVTASLARIRITRSPCE